MTERDHYSHSQFRLAFGDGGCLRAYFYRYVDKSYRPPVPGRLHVGTSWDRMTTKFMESVIHGTPMPEDEAIGIVVNTLENPPEKNKDGEPLDYDFSDVDLDDTRNRLEFAALNWLQVVAPEIRPVTVQQEVVVPFAKLDADLLGYIDLVELDDSDTLVITDNKASMSGRSTYNTDKATIDQQLLLYQYAVMQDSDIPVLTRGWRVVDIGYKKTLARFDSVFVKERSVADAQANANAAWSAAEDQAVLLDNAKKEGLFPPTGRGSWKCSHKYCDFFNICDYGHKARTAIPVSGAGED